MSLKKIAILYLLTSLKGIFALGDEGQKKPMISFISVAIFLVGYVGISLEKFTKIHKTSISLLLGVILWVIAFIGSQGNVAHSLQESIKEIFELVIFLLSAMTLVEILTHYGLFDMIYERLIKFQVKDTMQFWVITFLTFLLSSFLDNLTTTIIFIQMASRFFSGKNLIKTGAAIVIAANAGGAFSPIGDITTTMLWLAGKFSTQTIVTQVFLPSLSVLLISNYFIGKSIVADTKDIVEKVSFVTRSEWIIITLCLGSFILPLIMTIFLLPPYLGLLFGLGCVWFSVDILRRRHRGSSKLTMSIEKFFQKTDIASLYFFTGILLAIGALRHLGILDQISNIIFGPSPTFFRIASGNIAIGGLSAIFDNIPLTAAAIEIVKTDISSLWTLLAFSVGVGGSLLVIGSAPGIIAMTLIKELTFGAYIRVATIPALLGFIAGGIVWFTQFYLTGGSFSVL